MVFLSCAAPDRLQEISWHPGAGTYQSFFQHYQMAQPSAPAATAREDRRAGYDWELSIWQMEVSLTQVFDRPLRGREFFEEIIHDNLDLGRPDHVQLIFDRVVIEEKHRGSSAPA